MKIKREVQKKEEEHNKQEGQKKEGKNKKKQGRDKKESAVPMSEKAILEKRFGRSEDKSPEPKQGGLLAQHKRASKPVRKAPSAYEAPVVRCHSPEEMRKLQDSLHHQHELDKKLNKHEGQHRLPEGKDVSVEAEMKRRPSVTPHLDKKSDGDYSAKRESGDSSDESHASKKSVREQRLDFEADIRSRRGSTATVTTSKPSERCDVEAGATRREARPSTHDLP